MENFLCVAIGFSVLTSVFFFGNLIVFFDRKWNHLSKRKELFSS